MAIQLALPAIAEALSAILIASAKNDKGATNLPDPLKGYTFDMPTWKDLLPSDGPSEKDTRPNSDRGMDEELDTDQPLQDEPHPGLQLPDRPRSPEEAKQLEEFKKRFLKSDAEEEDDTDYTSDYPRGSREWIEEQMRKPIPPPTPGSKKPESKKPGPKPSGGTGKTDDRPGHGDPDYDRE